MDATGRRAWVQAVVLVGVLYAVIGAISAALAGRAESHQMVVEWRLAAWTASAIAFTTHIGYEHFRLRATPRTAAWHVAAAVALGGLGLAIAANIHAVTANTHRLLIPALVIWPVLTGLPAFVVALVAAALLARMRPHE